MQRGLRQHELAFGIIFLMWSSLSLATLINGAGATFPYPLYSKWFATYRNLSPSVQINYQSIGSGGGIRQFTDRTIDFGASDVPMTDEQLAKVGAPVLHFPVALGSIVVSYHLPGFSSLKLTSELLSAIFLGEIKKWEDPRIRKVNPQLNVSGDILVIHRSDGSGTTAVFTEYLKKISTAWSEKVGAGTSVNWPVGLGGKGNEGVAGLVKQTPNSIGYVEWVYAKKNNLPVALLQNRSGEFVGPSLEGVTSAAQASMKMMPKDFRTSITHPPGKKSYPIGSYTYLLVRQKMADPEKAKALSSFLNWAITDGQKVATELDYAPLPKSLVKKLQDSIQSIQVGPAS